MLNVDSEIYLKIREMSLQVDEELNSMVKFDGRTMTTASANKQVPTFSLLRIIINSLNQLES